MIKRTSFFTARLKHMAEIYETLIYKIFHLKIIIFIYSFLLKYFTEYESSLVSYLNRHYLFCLLYIQIC